MRSALLFSLVMTGAFAVACSDGARDDSATYEIQVRFHPDATNAEVAAVADYLDLDPTVFWAQDTDPPIFSAAWTSADVSCDIAIADLESRDYVRQVGCRERGVATPIASPDGSATYAIGVRFGDATSAEVAAVEDYLLDLDPIEFLVQDSEPPIFGVRWMSADVSCDMAKAELQSRDYVSQVNCSDGALPLAPDG